MIIKELQQMEPREPKPYDKDAQTGLKPEPCSGIYEALSVPRTDLEPGDLQAIAYMAIGAMIALAILYFLVPEGRALLNF